MCVKGVKGKEAGDALDLFFCFFWGGGLWKLAICYSKTKMVSLATFGYLKSDISYTPMYTLLGPMTSCSYMYGPQGESGVNFDSDERLENL